MICSRIINNPYLTLPAFIVLSSFSAWAAPIRPFSTPTPRIIPVECDENANPPIECQCRAIPEQCLLGKPPCIERRCIGALMPIDCNSICRGIQANLMAQCQSSSTQICYSGYCVDARCPEGTRRICKPWERSDDGTFGTCTASSRSCSLDCVCDGVMWFCKDDRTGQESPPTIFPTRIVDPHPTNAPNTPAPTATASAPTPTPTNTPTPLGAVRVFLRE